MKTLLKHQPLIRGLIGAIETLEHSYSDETAASDEINKFAGFKTAIAAFDLSATTTVAPTDSTAEEKETERKYLTIQKERIRKNGPTAQPTWRLDQQVSHSPMPLNSF